MANDLISRKALMQEIEKSMNNNPHTEPKVKVNHEQEHKHFMCLLSKQPTAYDVEKVVEELDEYITKIVGRNSALYQTIMRIVREGGVE